MFEDARLANHLKNNHTVKLRSIVLSEWNMNQTDNIRFVGNYKYRPAYEDVLNLSDLGTNVAESSGPGEESEFSKLIPLFDDADIANAYSDGTQSLLYVDAGYQDNEPVQFLAQNERMSRLYDIESCVEPFRPRSGINKAMINLARPQYTDKLRSAERPRYYASSIYDQFKYWNSFKTIDRETVGISAAIDNIGAGYQIHDAVPFVVYKEKIPCNRITVKMQTHVGSFSIGSGDPLFGSVNATIPKRWRVEYLTDDNVWKTALSFSENNKRIDGSPIIGWDGHVEIKYGLKVPEKYKDNFWFVDYLTDVDMLPPISAGVYVGEAYIVITDTSAGTLYVMNEDSEWDEYPAEYSFSLLENDDYGYGIRSCVTNITNPSYFMNSTNTIYREFLYIKGVRVVVETMNTPNTAFELIEMSPRLMVDLTKYVENFDFTKSIYNSESELPVGGFIASNGSITLSNDDLAFTKLNTNSIISKYLKPNVKFIFFEGIRNVGIYEKLIPIKWLYSEDFPTVIHQQATVSLDLRDLTFLLENKKAPEIFLRNVTLTSCIMILMDSIGFSNYRFIGFEDSDPILPNFFVGPDQNVAEVLKRISVATQSAMFFDEYNNFTVYSKEYLFDENRDITLNLNVDRDVFYDNGQWLDENGLNIGIQNIASIEPEKVSIINDGSINFTTRYIQRSVTKVKQATLTDEEREYGYKPILLWEVAPTDSDKSVNAAVQQQQGYVLGAAALNSDIDDIEPSVENNKIINNIIDLGANVFWLPRHEGYLYANGEIIKYDAIEYFVSGQEDLVWISNNREYQKYFGNLPFNGTIYPTGNIRIFAEPYYEIVDGITKAKNGPVRIHGRAQFGTKRTEHLAGINPEWTSGANLRGMSIDSLEIFSTSSTGVPVYTYSPISGSTSTIDIASRSKRTDIIKNFMSTKNFDEGEYINIDGDNISRTRSRYGIAAKNAAALRASALVFTGPQQFNGSNARDFITYINKTLDNKYSYFGTRMRIIGEINPNDTKIQSPLAAMQLFNVKPELSPDAVVISGGSGGIGVMLTENSGYFLEIMSLTEDVSKNFLDLVSPTSNFSELLQNVVLWKKSPNSNRVTKLWGGTTTILVDSGTFVGQDRAIKGNTPTVYDLAIEYRDENGVRKFNIYINNKKVASDIEDKTPLQITNSFGPFVRGSTKCMFENIFAVGANPSYANEYTDSLSEFVRPDINPETPSDVFRKFSMNSFVTDSYLTSLSPSNISKFILYYDEFGTILRECVYFNIKYDQAYPALYAKIAPTFNNERSYSISGFTPTPYGAKFLLFNNTDKANVLDETTGSFLRIIGIGFTQDTSYEYTVDEYFKKIGNFYDSKVIDNNLYAENPTKLSLELKDIKASRNTYGTNAFSLESDYIQTWQQADNLMGWIIGKRFKPKEKYSLEVFGVPHLQLADIVNIYYSDLIDPNKKFLVTDISHSRTLEGMSSSIKVVEI